MRCPGWTGLHRYRTRKVCPLCAVECAVSDRLIEWTPCRNTCTCRAAGRCGSLNGWWKSLELDWVGWREGGKKRGLKRCIANLMCLTNLFDRENPLPQIVHRHGFSPVWVRRWHCRSDDLGKPDSGCKNWNYVFSSTSPNEKLYLYHINHTYKASLPYVFACERSSLMNWRNFFHNIRTDAYPCYPFQRRVCELACEIYWKNVF